jgi:hypothetical protein
MERVEINREGKVLAEVFHMKQSRAVELMEEAERWIKRDFRAGYMFATLVDSPVIKTEAERLYVVAQIMLMLGIKQGSMQ